jgi:hypothetical protein
MGFPCREAGKDLVQAASVVKGLSLGLQLQGVDASRSSSSSTERSPLKLPPQAIQAMELVVEKLKVFFCVHMTCFCLIYTVT